MTAWINASQPKTNIAQIAIPADQPLDQAH